MIARRSILAAILGAPALAKAAAEPVGQTPPYQPTVASGACKPFDHKTDRLSDKLTEAYSDRHSDFDEFRISVNGMKSWSEAFKFSVIRREEKARSEFSRSVHRIRFNDDLSAVQKLQALRDLATKHGLGAVLK